ncbi:DMT family transporter [Lactiplantibacillus daowaiensis]|uniref:DMT family transporter n=1 Tax=Lactiplantibacillus daowaiensis TaxID=2559918 RepID=A0ABW1S370_9LACO|nr:DMT family transporter [Lactiplantibacillus daowaiensis]
MNKSQGLGMLLLSLAASIWGGMFVVVKAVVTIIDPITLVWARYLVALVGLGLACHWSRLTWHIRRRDWPLLIAIGLIGNTLSIGFQETGTWLTSAQLGAVVTSATPTFIIIFAHLILKERLTGLKIGAVALATSGVLLIVGVQLTGRQTLLGAGCLIIAALTWALMSVLVKKATAYYPPLQVTTIGTAIATVCLTPIVFSQPKTLLAIPWFTPQVSLSLLYLGLISTALAFVMWNRGLQLLPASRSGVFFLLQPLVGSLLGWAFLDEALTPGFVLGTLLIIGSIWLETRFSN